MIVKKDLPDCPVATTVGLIGNKWKLLILRDVLTGPKRFGELHRSLTGISQKVLTENLRSMEKDGLLKRTVFPEVPPRVEYMLSELGTSMRPIIHQLEEWGIGYKEIMTRTETPTIRTA
ncbi:DNA-binding transcriptional regulator, HxlR family [Desulfomicrobium norvegicum]|jgi:DNA-binding HxlR family transcriptional regulator|uniref:DNA-binding transcriptional regulator, HxlR family n=1 Tax=Desulfomicrobium norvegicum (strain DSM 1741 / NCIMB 8310) TaxID=52561 RepID=A0A8G2C5Y4_DESNO|nr:helix-turn-helix domain-containing protein [Desulfomicrobium norvegicum]SFM17717.1 DNA-binding transcriptional regulator, HxlR family [Desulfomicrobium norvegicum]